MPRYRVRRSSVGPATREDLRALLNLEHTGFDAPYYRPHQFRQADFVRYLRRPNSVLLVNRQARRPIGYAAGRLTRRSDRLVARLDSLTVLRSFRGLGHGRLLLHAFKETARTRRASAILLEVAALNRSAQAFFRRAGFAPVRRLPHYYGKTTDGILLKLHL